MVECVVVNLPSHWLECKGTIEVNLPYKKESVCIPLVQYLHHTKSNNNTKYRSTTNQVMYIPVTIMERETCSNQNIT